MVALTNFLLMSNILRAIVLANDVQTLPVGPHTEPEVVFNGMIIVGEFLRKSIMGMKMQYPSLFYRRTYDKLMTKMAL